MCGCQKGNPAPGTSQPLRQMEMGCWDGFHHGPKTQMDMILYGCCGSLTKRWLDSFPGRPPWRPGSPWIWVLAFPKKIFEGKFPLPFKKTPEKFGYWLIFPPPTPEQMERRLNQILKRYARCVLVWGKTQDKVSPWFSYNNYQRIQMAPFWRVYGQVGPPIVGPNLGKNQSFKGIPEKSG